MNKSKKYILILTTALVATLTAVAGSVLATNWTEPVSGPPGSNTPAPLNVSGVGQTKSGKLTVGSFQFVGGDVSLTGNAGNIFLKKNGATELGKIITDIDYLGFGKGDKKILKAFKKASTGVGAFQYCDLNGGNCVATENIVDINYITNVLTGYCAIGSSVEECRRATGSPTDGTDGTGGTDGTNGTNGKPGDTGPSGYTGAAGQDGRDGQDGVVDETVLRQYVTHAYLKSRYCSPKNSFLNMIPLYGQDFDRDNNNANYLCHTWKRTGWEGYLTLDEGNPPSGAVNRSPGDREPLLKGIEFSSSQNIKLGDIIIGRGDASSFTMADPLLSEGVNSPRIENGEVVTDSSGNPVLRSEAEVRRAIEDAFSGPMLNVEGGGLKLGGNLYVRGGSAEGSVIDGGLTVRGTNFEEGSDFSLSTTHGIATKKLSVWGGEIHLFSGGDREGVTDEQVGEISIKHDTITIKNGQAGDNGSVILTGGGASKIPNLEIGTSDTENPVSGKLVVNGTATIEKLELKAQGAGEGTEISAVNGGVKLGEVTITQGASANEVTIGNVTIAVVNGNVTIGGVTIPQNLDQRIRNLESLAHSRVSCGN
ncbi:hypothetical protein CSB11_01610 [Candidatus Campbellbacteria bacterium]|nr:MAG: hypothetical protein CSB11_01610 [Candidatus Campbellbacteria bacterium]